MDTKSAQETLQDTISPLLYLAFELSQRIGNLASPSA